MYALEGPLSLSLSLNFPLLLRELSEVGVVVPAPSDRHVANCCRYISVIILQVIC